MFDILKELVALSPIIAVLIVALIYFYKKEKSYKSELKDEKDNCEKRLDALNKELRINERDNLELLNKLADALSKLSVSSESVSRDLIDLKLEIMLKLNDITNKK